MRLVSAFLLCVLVASPLTVRSGQPSYQPTRVAVYFSPRGGATQACVDAIRTAQKAIRVQAYSFTSAPIAKALVEANRRGVSVVVVLDKSQRSERYSSADFLAHSGVPTFIDSKHAIAHNKIMIIDGETVITGSESPASLIAKLGLSFDPSLLVNHEDAKQYNERRDAYLDDYRNHLLQRAAWDNRMRRSLELSIEISNEGTIPAQGIVLKMHFPDGFLLLDKPPKKPEPPDFPRKPFPWGSLDTGGLSALHSSPINLGTLLPATIPNVSRPEIRQSNSYDVDFNVRKLMHGFRETLRPLFVLFDDLPAKSFGIDYEIHAENQPMPSRGTLQVIVSGA